MRTKDQYEAEKIEREKRQKERAPMPWWWLQQRDPIARFTAYLAVFTGLLIGVSLLQFCALESADRTTRDALEESSRAWLAISTVKLANTPQLGEPVEFTVGYKDTGKEPASGIAKNSRSEYAPFTRTATGDAIVYAGANPTCDGLKPLRDGPVAYPSLERYDGFHTAFRVDEDFLAGRKLIILQGCYVYESFGKPHHSRYCFWLRHDPHFSPDWMISECGDGIGAN